MEIQISDINSSRVLIAALDWGMGHTTRCVPLIRKLIAQKNEIFFAGNDVQMKFMKREFPDIQTACLDGYNVTLNSKRSTYIQVFNQFRKISTAIKNENKFLRDFAVNEKIEFVISDNRYGLQTEKTKNILVSHQLNLQLPFLKKYVNSRLRRWIEKFDCIWIPDREQKSLCGALISAEFKIPKVYIGLLCRFEKIPATIKYDCLFIASGPEPERTRFAKIISELLTNSGKSYALVGVASMNPEIDSYLNPTTKELNTIIASSKKIISRAGYTTIMEMLCLEKSCILVPTPGQYEQEYLAQVIQSDIIEFLDEKNLKKYFLTNLTV